jgi:hypothetical protein
MKTVLMCRANKCNYKVVAKESKVEKEAEEEEETEAEVSETEGEGESEEEEEEEEELEEEEEEEKNDAEFEKQEREDEEFRVVVEAAEAALEGAVFGCGEWVWIWDENTAARGLKQGEQSWKVFKAKIVKIEGSTHHLQFGSAGSWTYSLEMLYRTQAEAREKMDEELDFLSKADQ